MWPVGLLTLAVFWAFTYRETRVYVLDPADKTYTFRLGHKIVQRGQYHNCYVRLRKRIGTCASELRSWRFILLGPNIWPCLACYACCLKAV